MYLKPPRRRREKNYRYGAVSFFLAQEKYVSVPKIASPEAPNKSIVTALCFFFSKEKMLVYLKSPRRRREKSYRYSAVFYAKEKYVSVPEIASPEARKKLSLRRCVFC